MPVLFLFLWVAHAAESPPSLLDEILSRPRAPPSTAELAARETSRIEDLRAQVAQMERAASGVRKPAQADGAQKFVDNLVTDVMDRSGVWHFANIWETQQRIFLKKFSKPCFPQRHQPPADRLGLGVKSMTCWHARALQRLPWLEGKRWNQSKQVRQLVFVGIVVCCLVPLLTQRP